MFIPFQVNFLFCNESVRPAAATFFSNAALRTKSLTTPVLDHDLCRVTDINTYEPACWPNFGLETFNASSNGVTCYTCDCISTNAMDFGKKKWGTKNILSPQLQKVGGGMSSPSPP